MTAMIVLRDRGSAIGGGLATVPHARRWQGAGNETKSRQGFDDTHEFITASRGLGVRIPRISPGGQFVAGNRVDPLARHALRHVSIGALHEVRAVG
jgi:hypothetical protein